MADVKIIDIDSEQWNMKDQTARDRLDELEKLTTKTWSDNGFNFTAKKQGKLVLLIWSGTYQPSTRAAHVGFSNLPAGWEPVMDINGTLINNSIDSPRGQVVCRNTSGRIDLYANSNNLVQGNSFTGQLTYPLE